MKKIIGKTIWNFAEYFNISLNKFAPIVFGWMIGSKGRKLSDKEIRDRYIIKGEDVKQQGMISDIIPRGKGDGK